MAVAPVFLAKTSHPSAFLKVSAIFLQAYFSETTQKFKTEPQLNALSGHVRRFRLGDFISFENTIFAKMFRVFSDFAWFHHLNHIELSQNRCQLTQEDVFSKVVKVLLPYN